MKRDICIDRLRSQAQKRPDEAVYFSEINGQWQGILWRDYYQKVKCFAKAMIAMDFPIGTKVAILGYNRLEWMVSCLGAQYAFGISVGVYTSSSTEEVFYVVNHSDAEILVVENLTRFTRQVKPHLDQMTRVKHVILMSEESSDDPRVMSFSQFLARAESSDEGLEKRCAQIKSSDAATMIYTSGTTGNPKSVMLSHQALAWTVRQVVQAWHCAPTDRAFSYLPLAHIAEQMISIYAPLDSGMQVYLVTSPENFKRNLSNVQPTVFFGVPRVYEKVYEAIKAGISEQSLVKRLIFGHFSKVASEYYKIDHAGKVPSLLLRIQYLASKKMFAVLKQKIGFGKARLCACGAAPISKDILHFFTGIDLPIYEVFGKARTVDLRP